jgi:hypothetical protein
MNFVAANANYALVDTGGEGASTTLSGLVIGRTYTYGVEWQQFQQGVYEGGQLAMTINGVKKIFTSSGLDPRHHGQRNGRKHTKQQHKPHGSLQIVRRIHLAQDLARICRVSAVIGECVPDCVDWSSQ